ncbi:hypothetical protein COT95_01835 [Candidatus Falkowbacteria bacterium CG10_big_fil_rev_8_21_14_0_10_37_6]|uniref:SLC41A/MgtE integral membrane domain-containing protein n=1 Tax=Candidatus Falkowbacteria bacterium CG10_big_fil_rev_8_21_14_0_10_37_6 TaxID=1974563 RepID=A0A2H0V921_9BACT|nr:MAG: hypothetical protein COT95_01835 [Candidatus Falkowbacteria bacterium CG10_big_fil_rev_8_21_14_0_10_37_6]
MKNHKKTTYADDDCESTRTLFQLRGPALFAGLLLGIGISFITSSFEEVLASNVQVAFFLPFVVYIADAIGTQTETIYSRDLKSGRAKFINYFHKELFLGLIFGGIFGVCSGIISFLWLRNPLLTASIALSTFCVVAVAPILALCITHAFNSFHKDPAAVSGPITTVIQDMTSVIIYGIICSVIIL